MKLRAKDIGVDSGTIVIVDLSYFDKLKGKKSHGNDGQEFVLENGLYNIDWKMTNTWNGTVTGTGQVKITSGKLIVVDPCYLVEHGWHKLLDSTDYFQRPPDGMIVLDKHGGDGKFDVSMTLTKVKPDINVAIIGHPKLDLTIEKEIAKHVALGKTKGTITDTRGDGAVHSWELIVNSRL